MEMKARKLSKIRAKQKRKKSKEEMKELNVYTLENAVVTLKGVEAQMLLYALEIYPFITTTDFFGTAVRINGTLHRLDGPAIEGEDCSKWFIDGVEFRDEKHFTETITVIKNMPASLRLTDPREWVRKL